MVALSEQTLGTAQGRLFQTSEKLAARPFLKWAGGKSRLLPELRRYLPKQGYARYIEPFLGGGAFFFDLAPESAILGDSNPELINCYEAVRDEPDNVLGALSELRVTERDYYRIRSWEPRKLTRTVRAARLIYLNKTCFNGVYRVNKDGQFNTPFGKYDEKLSLVDPVNLHATSRALGRAELICGDYREVLAVSRADDFVYLDPPYLPVSQFADFKRYTKEFFYEGDHEKLAAEFGRLARLGCHALLSNSFHKKIATLYSAHTQRTVLVPRFVNCKGTGRGSVTELLISNYLPET